MHVVIVGCGVIGVTTAWFLIQAGVRVTVVERREGPALETSFANASMLTPSLSAPWNSPGVAQASEIPGPQGSCSACQAGRVSRTAAVGLPVLV